MDKVIPLFVSFLSNIISYIYFLAVGRVRGVNSTFLKAKIECKEIRGKFAQISIFSDLRLFNSDFEHIPSRKI